jgi:uncharacterized phage-associated protein
MTANRPPIRFAYDREKAGELAARLVKLAGGSMPLVKLLKLMYLADRNSLIDTGSPITGDAIVAMDMGPVLSRTYNHLKPPADLPFVTRSEGGPVTLTDALPENGRLSDYEVDLVGRVFGKFGGKSGQQLSAILHANAPEWASPDGSSRSIDPAEILRAAGKSEEEIEAIAKEARYFVSVHPYIA